MSKFSGFYAPWEHPVCPDCLADKEYCLHLVLVQCLKPDSHSRNRVRVPVVVDKHSLLLREVKPLPGHAFQFRGGFVECRHYPDCWNNACRFTHSELDRIAWSTKKFVLLKGRPAWSGYESTLHTYTHTN